MTRIHPNWRIPLEVECRLCHEGQIWTRWPEDTNWTKRACKRCSETGREPLPFTEVWGK